MQSDARKVLRKLFKDLNIGDKFQLVNSVMGGAMPTSPILIRVEITGYNAKFVNSDSLVKIRETAEVEMVE